jgi:hypothetical protein
MDFDFILKSAGERALERGLAAWNRDIIDPPGRSLNDPAFDSDRTEIDSYIRNGLLLGGTQNPKTFRYSKDGDYEWCGAFAAHCWEPFVHPDLRQLYFPSTYRLDCYGRYLSGFKTPNAIKILERFPKQAVGGRKHIRISHETPVETVNSFGPRAGDILLVGTSTGPGYGAHITIVERWDPATKMFHTVEGNGTGLGPDGKRRQGVVKALRPLGGANPARLYHALCLIRPGINDLVSTKP